MRRPIWFKDDYFPMGDKHIYMDPVVVKIPKGLLALSWQFNHDLDSLLGHVDAVRFEDGEITGVVNLLDTHQGRAAYDLLEHGEVRLGGYYTDIEKSEDDKRVLAATLRAVSVVIDWGRNPGAKAKGG